MTGTTMMCLLVALQSVLLSSENPAQKKTKFEPGTYGIDSTRYFTILVEVCLIFVTYTPRPFATALHRVLISREVLISRLQPSEIISSFSHRSAVMRGKNADRG